jgi:hypothetical protein
MRQRVCSAVILSSSSQALTKALLNFRPSQLLFDMPAGRLCTWIDVRNIGYARAGATPDQQSTVHAEVRSAAARTYRMYCSLADVRSSDDRVQGLAPRAHDVRGAGLVL